MRYVLKKSLIIRLNMRDHHRARPAKRVGALHCGQGSAYFIAKRANYTSVPAFDLLDKMDVPHFLDDLAAHPHFKDRPWDTDAHTKFDLWDSAQVRIPTSTFSPEPRVARVSAVSGLPKKDNPGPTARSDAVFYRSTSADITHEAATIHGEWGLTTESSFIKPFLLIAFSVQIIALGD